ncbi:tetratricopeptide repeat-containing sulfotransferase family protein [Catenovulum maritimum]|uniref:Uncharacterized protein n=1 Tax=Catenovulum maritimum TaxID=1513271 RepID=A0A0J8JK22_9ALTE|nr:tetratricopeptide repeat-containing sulfotransferase family protein [Catenovulum maritimum]KMT64806.1 hypothetical protein XM47_12195 [Catenovulum maritimum]
MLQKIQALIKTGNIQQAWHLLQTLNQSELGEQALYLAAVCNRYLHKSDVALDYLEQLLRLNACHARAYQEQGYNFLLLKQTEKAQAALSKAVKFNPSLTSAWQKLAEVYQLSGLNNLAHNALANAEYYQNLPLHIRSGYSKLYEGDITQAQTLCQTFLSQQPDNLEAMRLLAQIANANQAYDKAEFLLESALLLQPNNAFCLFDLALVLQNRQKFSQAYQIAQKLVKQSSDNLSFLLCLANQAASINEFEEAEHLYQKVLHSLPLSPERAPVHIALGHLYKTLGQVEKAQINYQTAYQLDNEYADAYWSLANLKRYQFSQAELQLMLDTLEQKALTNTDKCLLSFALAKAFELKQNYQRSACFYQTANHLRLSELNYDNQQQVESLKQQKQNFPSTLFVENKPIKRQEQSSASAKITPIFIVGLPRAGSTLLEQILASHSQVQGTMELPNIMQIANELEQKAKEQKQKLPDYLAILSAEEFSQLGERYIQETQIHHNNRSYFIDKMPNNFKHLGLIKLMLPQAKIIDIRRNIKDACMANYKQYFAQGQLFSYNLQHCANFYHAYQDLIQYWSSIIHQDLLRIQYEHLVTEPESVVNKICQLLEIGYEANMLNFYKTKRAVKTPSSEQVRQPIYQSSLDSWKLFANYLPELRLIKD